MFTNLHKIPTKVHEELFGHISSFEGHIFQNPIWPPYEVRKSGNMHFLPCGSMRFRKCVAFKIPKIFERTHFGHSGLDYILII